MKLNKNKTLIYKIVFDKKLKQEKKTRDFKT